MVLGSNTVIQLDVLGTMLQVFIVVIIPVSLGMLLKAKKDAFALKMEKPVRQASGIIFVLVLAGVIIKEKDNLLPYADQAGVIALVLNLLTMGTGYLIANLMKLNVRHRKLYMSDLSAVCFPLTRQRRATSWCSYL